VESDEARKSATVAIPGPLAIIVEPCPYVNITFTGMKILIVLMLTCYVYNAYSQIIITGYVKDERGNALSLVNIQEVNTDNSTRTDNKGFFELTLTKNNSTIRIWQIGYSDILLGSDNIRDNYTYTMQSNPVSFADPGVAHHPYFEIGYKGYISDFPFGIHATYAYWFERFKLHAGFATKDFNEFYSNIGLYPFGPRDFKPRKLNINFKGFLIFADTMSKSEIFILNDFYISEKLTFKLGAGTKLTNMDKNPIFVGGLRFEFLDLIVIGKQFLDFEIYIRQNSVEWIGKFNTTVFDTGGYNFSFTLGHQKFFGFSGLIAGLNYRIVDSRI
jgi:hypothetical protein